MDKRAKLAAAAKLFEDFTGDEASTIESVVVPPDTTLMVIGDCDAIAYTATRDGETASYQHEFKKSSRPVLAVSHDGKRLYLIAGSYRFTHRGIEDT